MRSVLRAIATLSIVASDLPRELLLNGASSPAELAVSGVSDQVVELVDPMGASPPSAVDDPGAGRDNGPHPKLGYGPVTESSSICGVAAFVPPGKSRRTYCACVAGKLIVSVPLELDGELPTVCQVVPSVEVSTL